MADSNGSNAVSAGTLYDKVWTLHQVAELPGGSTQLFIGLHLIHEVTSPQAFAGLKDLGLSVCPPNALWPRWISLCPLLSVLSQQF